MNFIRPAFAFTLFAMLLSLTACAAEQKPYEEGRYMIWSGRGAILTAKADLAPESWELPSDPPINERVIIIRKKGSGDRLIQPPEHLVESQQQPNALTDEEVQTLQASAARYRNDELFEFAARIWDYLANDRPDNASFAFSAARLWALKGNVVEATRAAREAWARGFDDIDSYHKHADFAAIAKSRAWVSMLIEFEVRAARVDE